MNNFLFSTIEINRDEFNKLIKSYIDKTLTTIKQVSEDAELHSSEIDEIIMVVVTFSICGDDK